MENNCDLNQHANIENEQSNVPSTEINTDSSVLVMKENLVSQTIIDVHSAHETAMLNNSDDCGLPKKPKLDENALSIQGRNDSNEKIATKENKLECQSVEFNNEITDSATVENEEKNHCSAETEGRLCPSVVERYYTKRYEVNLPKGFKEFEESKCTNFNDVCILRHSNKLCIISLAPSHPVIKNKDAISVTDVSYKVSDRLDHSNNQVSGKRKRGAHWLNESTPVCIVTCSDGSKYTIHSGARGKLIEINEQLQANPSLLQTAHMTNGYIAILMPKVTEGTKVLDDLLTEEQYQDYLLSNLCC